MVCLAAYTMDDLLRNNPHCFGAMDEVGLPMAYINIVKVSGGCWGAGRGVGSEGCKGLMNARSWCREVGRGVWELWNKNSRAQRFRCKRCEGGLRRVRKKCEKGEGSEKEVGRLPSVL